MKTPVTILSGFLGAGKTTFLLQWIDALIRNNKKPFVLINELGTSDVSGSVAAAVYPELDIVTALDGCFCCKRKPDLHNYLDLALSKGVDHIVIEMSGMGNPLEVVDTISEFGYRNRLFIDRIIGVIDGSLIAMNQEILVKNALDAIKTADEIFINKSDIVAPAQRQSVEDKIRSVAPGTLHWVSQSRVSPTTLDEWLAASKDGFGELNPHTNLNSVYITIPNHPFLTAIKIESWIKKFSISLSRTIIQPGKIVRAKGYVRLSGAEEVYLYQFSNGSHDWQGATNLGESYVILVGKELDQKQLQNDFHEHFPAW